MHSTYAWYCWSLSPLVTLMMLLASYNASARTNGVTWPKNHVAPQFNHLDLRNAMMTLTTLASCVNGIIDSKVHLDFILIVVDLRNGMVLLMTLLTSCETDAYTNGITWPKSNVVPYFWPSWPKEGNCAIDGAVHITWYWHWCKWYHMTSTPVPVLSCDAGVDVSDITWQKSDVTPDFNCLNQRNPVVTLKMLLVWCDTYVSANDIKSPKGQVHLISISWPQECSGAICEAIDTMWCQHQCQCLHLILIILTKMQWYH